MTIRRSSFTKHAAIKYVAYYDKLLAQIKSGKPLGMFLSTADFGNVKVGTLHNRFRDALNWLKNYNMDPIIDKRKDYEYLAAVMTVKDEANGIRIVILSGPGPSATVRTEESIKEQADWKIGVEQWITEGTEPVKVFENCRVFGENKTWLDRVTTACGVSYYLDGDRLTLARQ